MADTIGGLRIPTLWLCGALLIATAPVLAAQAFSAATLQKLCREDWYTVSVLGKPAGYAHNKTQAVTVDGVEQIEAVERVVVHLSINGPALAIETEQVTRFDDALRPVFYRLSENQMGRRKTTEATLTAGVLRVSIVAPGTEATRELRVAPNYGTDLAVAAELVQGELKSGDQRVIQTFSPELGELDEVTVTVAAVPTVADERYKLVARSKLMGVEAATYILPDGTMVRQEAPGLLNMMLERVPEAEAVAATVSPLKISNSIPIDRVIPNTSGLRELTLVARGQAEPPSEYIPSCPRQVVVAEDDGSAVVRLRRTGFSGTALRLPIQDPKLAEYLKATEVAQSDDPQIVARAREIVGGETDAWEAAQALTGWVFRQMTKVESEPQPVTALEVLHSMRGDCTEHAVLLAALARAVGLPSQMVAGVVYKNGAFWYHAWNKVYVGEWVDVDPAWGEATVSVGHLGLAQAALDNLSMARMNLTTGRTIGTLRLEVKDWK